MANRHRRRHLNISALWWMWSRPTFRAAACAKRAVLTTLTAALLIAELGPNPMLCVQSTLEPAELQKQDLDPNVVFGFTNSSNSAAFSGHLCCKHNLCGVPSSSLHSPSLQGLLLSSLGLPSKQELKSCLCQAPVCSRVCRALYASTRLRCNESSINYCANNAH